MKGAWDDRFSVAALPVLVGIRRRQHMTLDDT
jgi:hypothetical protein